MQRSASRQAGRAVRWGCSELGKHSRCGAGSCATATSTAAAGRIAAHGTATRRVILTAASAAATRASYARAAAASSCCNAHTCAGTSARTRCSGSARRDRDRPRAQCSQTSARWKQSSSTVGAQESATASSQLSGHMTNQHQQSDASSATALCVCPDCAARQPLESESYVRPCNGPNGCRGRQHPFHPRKVLPAQPPSLVHAASANGARPPNLPRVRMRGRHLQAQRTASKPPLQMGSIPSVSSHTRNSQRFAHSSSTAVQCDDKIMTTILGY